MNPRSPTRRDVLHAGVVTASALGLAAARREEEEPLFRISLAQWSLNRSLRGMQEPGIDNLEFAATAHDLGIDAVEYVNTFFKDEVESRDYLKEMKTRAADVDVKQLLIMCDGLGALGDADETKRTKAVENHYPWVEAAKYLGCHSIRVNAASSGTQIS